MGTSVPAEPHWDDDASPAERSLWRWAVEQLPDRVLVLPNVMMTIPSRGRPDEAEIDLVLVDPDHGVMVVEVKGGTVSYDGDRAQWTGVRRDPVQQAKRARSILKQALKQANLDPAVIAMRWAMATPDCRLEAPGAPILPEAHLWDATAADHLADRYHRTCGELVLGEQPLGEERANYLARYLSGRTRDGRPVLSTAVADHEDRVRIHSQSHQRALRQIWANRLVLVRGPAGTGKTVLGMEVAVTFASQGQRVLLTCWNVVLADWLRAQLRAELAEAGLDPAEVTDDPTGRIVVGHLVGLARHGIVATEQETPGDDATAAERHGWYHGRLPQALDVSVTQGEFDVVVLDEAQDLTEEWVWAVAGLVAKGGRWYAFSDRQQDLFSAASELAEFLEHPHALDENFRNSRQVAAFAAQFGDISTDCVTGDGPEVGYVACPSDRIEARAVEVARRLVRDEGLDESDVAVLCLFANPFRGRTDELAEQAAAGSMVVTNSASFKGMERPAVVLGLDMHPDRADRADEVSRAIYAAATRARSHLVVVGDPEVTDAYGFTDLTSALRDADHA